MGNIKNQTELIKKLKGIVYRKDLREQVMKMS